MAGDGPLQSWPWTVSWARPRGDSRAIGHVFLTRAGNPLGLHTVQDLADRRTRVVLATLQEAGAREQYLDTLSMLAPLGCGEGDPGPRNVRISRTARDPAPGRAVCRGQRTGRCGTSRTPLIFRYAPEDFCARPSFWSRCCKVSREMPSQRAARS